MAAASDLFASRGVGEVTMAQIAEAAGLQQSSIYYWFRSKSDVLGSILERVNRGGQAYLSHTKLHDRFVLRLAIGNIRTERRHVEAAWRQLVEAAKTESTG